MKHALVLSLVFLGLTVAGCQSTPDPQLIKRQLVVITPPEDMYDCPIKRKYPNWQTLNDVEVAKTVLELHKNNVRCKASIDAIKKFLADAKVKIGQDD